MALPLEFHETFEAGTKGNFDSESDSGNRLDFPHQMDIGDRMMPWRGAYMCRVSLGKNSTDAYLEEGVSWASGQNRWGRFKLFIGEDVQFGNDLDHVVILQFYSSTSTRECRLVLARIEPLGIVLVVEMDGESWNANNAHFKVPIGEWFTVEWEKDVDSSDGYLGAILPDVCRITSREAAEGTITKFRLGAIDQDGDITGTIYFDDFMVDEDRLYDDPSAHNGALSGGSLFFLQSGFAFLGEGAIDHVTLIDGGSNDCAVKIYDAFEPTALPAGSLRYDLKARERQPDAADQLQPGAVPPRGLRAAFGHQPAGDRAPRDRLRATGRSGIMAASQTMEAVMNWGQRAAR